MKVEVERERLGLTFPGIDLFHLEFDYWKFKNRTCEKYRCQKSDPPSMHRAPL